MFGDILFEEVEFGVTLEEELASEDTSIPVLDVSKFFPQASLDSPLMAGVVELLEYIIHRYHYSELVKISGLYDVFHPDFNSDQMVKFLGGDKFFVQTLTDEQKRSLALMLSNLYEIKGLRKGIEGVLGMVGYPAYLYESWEVQEEAETGMASPRALAAGLPCLFTEAIPRCTVAVVFDVTNQCVKLEGLDAAVRSALDHLLWVCASIYEYIWLKKEEDKYFSDFPDSNTDLSSEQSEMQACSKYGFQDEEDLCGDHRPIVESEDVAEDLRSLEIFASYQEEVYVPAEYGVPLNGITPWYGHIHPQSDGNGWGEYPWEYDVSTNTLSVLNFTGNVDLEWPGYAVPTAVVLLSSYGDSGSVNDPLYGDYQVSFHLSCPTGKTVLILLVPVDTPWIEEAYAGTLTHPYDWLGAYSTPMSQVLFEEESETDFISKVFNFDGSHFALALFGFSDGVRFDAVVSDISLKRVEDLVVPEESAYTNIGDLGRSYWDVLPKGYVEPQVLVGVDTVDFVGFKIRTHVLLPEGGRFRLIWDHVPVGFVGTTFYAVNVVEDLSGEFVWCQVASSLGGVPIEFSVVGDPPTVFSVESLDPTVEMLGVPDASMIGWDFGSVVAFPAEPWASVVDLGGGSLGLQLDATIADVRNGSYNCVVLPSDMRNYLGGVAGILTQESLGSGFLRVSFDAVITAGVLQYLVLEFRPPTGFSFYGDELVMYSGSVSSSGRVDLNVDLPSDWFSFKDVFVVVMVSSALYGASGVVGTLSNIKVDVYPTDSTFGLADAETDFGWCGPYQASIGLDPDHPADVVLVPDEELENDRRFFWKVACLDAVVCCQEYPILPSGPSVEFVPAPIITLGDSDVVGGFYYNWEQIPTSAELLDPPSPAPSYLRPWDFGSEQVTVSMADDLVVVPGNVTEIRHCGVVWDTGTPVCVGTPSGAYGLLPEPLLSNFEDEGRTNYYVILLDSTDPLDIGIALADTYENALLGTGIEFTGIPVSGEYLFYVYGSQASREFRELPQYSRVSLPTGVDPVTDIITVSVDWPTGTAVRLRADGGMPSSSIGVLLEYTTYFVINIGSTQIKLAVTLEDALADTPIPIDLVGYVGDPAGFYVLGT